MASTTYEQVPITDRYPGLRNLMMEFHQMKDFLADPLVVTDGEGVRVRDQDGRWYYDGVSGIAAIQLGHGNQPIIDAMKAQMDRIALALPVHAVNEPEIQLAEMLAGITPPEFTKVKFASGGSEANETAIKLVRQFHKQTGNPGKYKVISRYKSFHGATLGTLAATGGAARKSKFEPLPTGFVHVHPPECYQCPFKLTYPDCGVACARILEDVILGEGPETVAAFIAEPVVMSAEAFYVPPMEYLQIIREICDRFNVTLIFDEIVTGFGRLGEMFAADAFGVYPDIITVGKGLSSGYAPLSAVIMRDEIAGSFWGDTAENVHFNSGHTYSGSPVACAAGVSAVRQIRDDEVLGNARQQGKHLQARLLDMGERYDVIGQVEGRGLLWGVEFVTDRNTHARFPVDRPFGRAVGRAARKGGLIARAGNDAFVFAPPLVVTKTEIDDMADILDAAIAETLEGYSQG